MVERAPEPIWYVAYGSNLATDRFRCYVSGGRPVGAARGYPGCRDPSEPTRSTAVEVTGRLVFAGRSSVWGGGMAFYDPTGTGVVAGCAHLVTREQFADVAAQELRREPGGKFAADLAGLLPDVETVVVTGPGRYETVVRLGELEGGAMFTITHHDVGSLPLAAPTAPYLHWIAVGLRESHGYDVARIVHYLLDAPGVSGAWSETELRAVVEPAVGTAT